MGCGLLMRSSRVTTPVIAEEPLTLEEEQFYRSGINAYGENLAYAFLRADQSQAQYPTKTQVVALQLSRAPSMASIAPNFFQRISRAPSSKSAKSVVSETPSLTAPSLDSSVNLDLTLSSDTSIGVAPVPINGESESTASLSTLLSSLAEDVSWCHIEDVDTSDARSRLIIGQRPGIDLAPHIGPAFCASKHYWRNSMLDTRNASLHPLKATRLWKRARRETSKLYQGDDHTVTAQARLSHSYAEPECWSVIVPEDSVSLISQRQNGGDDMFDFEKPGFDPETGYVV